MPTRDLVLEEMEGGIGQLLELSRSNMQSIALDHLPIGNLCEDQDPNVDLIEAGRQGWVRVVVMIRGEDREVSWVKYLHPGPQSSGSGFQDKTMNCISMEKYLHHTGNPGGLGKKNFSFSLQTLGLGEPYEVVRQSAGKPLLFSYFKKYFFWLNRGGPKPLLE